MGRFKQLNLRSSERGRTPLWLQPHAGEVSGQWRAKREIMCASIVADRQFQASYHIVDHYHASPETLHITPHLSMRLSIRIHVSSSLHVLCIPQSKSRCIHIGLGLSTPKCHPTEVEMATEWDISRRVGDAASDSFERYPDFRISRPEPISLPSTAQAETSSGSANSSVNELPDFTPAAPQLSSQSAQRELFSGIATGSDVNDAARYCMRAFSSLISAPKEQQATDNETIKFSKANRIVFMNQFSRFKTWAAKVEALSAGFSSVNYRLDGDSVIGDVLLKLLKRLSEKLESVPTGDSSPSMRSVPGKDDADTISSDSSSESEDESSRGEEKDRNTPPQPLWIRIIEETITNLYKITTLAERSNIHTEDQSMAKWLERNSTEVDDELSDLRLHIQRLLEKKFARLRFSPFLKDRLILAVLNRRKRLLYHGSRHQKCQHGVKDAFDSMVLASTSPLETQRGIHTRSVPEHPPSLASKGKGKAVDSSSPQCLDVALTSRCEPGVTEFACPYCTQPLGEEMFSADKTNWK